jgi:hypothetical protein
MDGDPGTIGGDDVEAGDRRCGHAWHSGPQHRACGIPPSGRRAGAARANASQAR